MDTGELGTDVVVAMYISALLAGSDVASSDSAYLSGMHSYSYLSASWLEDGDT